MQNIIEINNLDKSFQDVHAVNDLSLRVKEGELFAFLGVNGAGKSTTISIMCGMLAKDGGKVFIDGKDVDKDMREITKELGVVFQNTVLDAKLSVKDNLTSRAALYGITGKEAKQRIAHLAELLEFKDILNRTFGKLSGGQKRRVDVARSAQQPKNSHFGRAYDGTRSRSEKSSLERSDDFAQESEHDGVFDDALYGRGGGR